MGARFVELGVDEVDFADTAGMAVPTQVDRMLRRARQEFGEGLRLGVHLHNTRNTGIANAYAAVVAGVDVIDASTGGAGGGARPAAASGPRSSAGHVTLGTAGRDSWPLRPASRPPKIRR